VTGTHALVESSFVRWPRRPRPRPRPRPINKFHYKKLTLYFCNLPSPRPRPSPPSPRKPPPRPIKIKLNLWKWSFTNTNLLHDHLHHHVLNSRKQNIIKIYYNKSFDLPPRVPKPPRVPPRSAIFDLLLVNYLKIKQLKTLYQKKIIVLYLNKSFHIIHQMILDDHELNEVLHIFD
jgi:hypothetical protein